MSDIPPLPPVLSAMERYRRLLEAKDVAAANRLISHYRGSWKRLAAMLDSLLLQIGDKKPTLGQLVRMERYKMLLQQIAAELAGLSALTADEVEQAGKLGIAWGEAHTRELISLTINGTPQLAAVFNKLPTTTIETLLGFLDPAGALYARLRLLAPTATAAVSRAIIEGVTLGQNPRVIARMVMNAFGRGLTDALRFVRTAQIWSYRESSRAGMVSNADVLNGWQWVAALDNRVCGACAAMHGSIHSVDETLNGHHNCRCRPCPVVVGYEKPVETTGEEWFNSLSETEQRWRLGPGKFDAWSAGQFKFTDLPGIHNDSVYGDMVIERSLKDLIENVLQ